MGKSKSGIKKDKGIRIAATAVVDKKAKIGKGTAVWNFAQIMHSVSVGKNCVIGNGVFIDRNVVIGNNVKIHNKALIYRGVKIEDDCFIGPSACFVNDKNPRNFKTRDINKPEWFVKKGATIGAGAVILSDINIGKYAMVGAGAVVTKDVKDYGLVIGNPAVLKGYVCKCGGKLKKTKRGYYCGECKSYIRICR